jgi:hypothetical protein
LGGVIKRLAIFALFVGAAMLTAGVFGAVHDQISYSVSNEYFTKFKFVQFHLLDSVLPERLRVAIVGFLASWWMGIPLGILTGIAGFIYPSAGRMSRGLALSLPLICAFVLLAALAGLIYGVVQTSTLNLSNYRGWFMPIELEFPRRFICAGYMHNSAYIGGAAAIPASWLFNFFYRRWSTHAAQQPHAALRDG